MSAKGKQWKLETLRLDEVLAHKDFQFRVQGTGFPYVVRLHQVLKDGEQLPPIRAARIGDNVYLLDGHHRLEAHLRAKRVTIMAEVARMSLEEAREEARKANTAHGKPLSRKDKQAIWAGFVREGKHLTEFGTARPIADICRDLGRLWDRKTIRKRLRDMKIELDESDGLERKWEPREDDEDDVDEAKLAKQVEDEVGAAALDGLGLFLHNYNRLPGDEQGRLLELAERLMGALRGGQTLEEIPRLLDI